LQTSSPVFPAGNVSVGFIGAGNVASSVLIPTFREAGARLVAIASEKGVTAAHAARKYGFESATADYMSVVSDPKINTVVIATRHDAHAGW